MFMDYEFQSSMYNYRSYHKVLSLRLIDKVTLNQVHSHIQVNDSEVNR
jgi:hypothetical protein